MYTEENHTHRPRSFWQKYISKFSMTFSAKKIGKRFSAMRGVGTLSGKIRKLHSIWANNTQWPYFHHTHFLHTFTFFTFTVQPPVLMVFFSLNINKGTLINKILRRTWYMYIAVFMLSAKLNQFKDNLGTNRDTPWLWPRRTKCRRWLVMLAVRGLAGYQRGFRC